MDTVNLGPRGKDININDHFSTTNVTLSLVGLESPGVRQDSRGTGVLGRQKMRRVKVLRKSPGYSKAY